VTGVQTCALPISKGIAIWGDDSDVIIEQIKTAFGLP
jgi:hypothetical protein